IFVNASISVTVVASPSSICAGASSTLIASGASSYIWSNGAIGASITVRPNATTTYTVTGSTGGCSANASVTVIVTSSPNVTVFVNASPSVTVVASPASICGGGSATLIASGATSYLWSNGAVGASITVNPIATTSYMVTGSTGGCSANASVTVIVTASPNVT